MVLRRALLSRAAPLRELCRESAGRCRKQTRNRAV